MTPLPYGVKREQRGEMFIENTQPPVLEQLATGGFSIGNGTVYTYGNTIHNPDDGPIDKYLLAHEATHMRQQKVIGSAEWWQRWLTDPIFRADQETQAYARQYRAYCEDHRDRNQRNAYLMQIAGHLGSGMYRLHMSTLDARRAILSLSE